MNSVTECDILFFCRDSRILPSIGQQTFSMVELEGPNYVRFFNIGDNVVANLKNILQSENYWPEGLISKDSTRRASNCQEFKCQVESGEQHWRKIERFTREFLGLTLDNEAKVSTSRTQGWRQVGRPQNCLFQSVSSTTHACHEQKRVQRFWNDSGLPNSQ